jgi:hypothetical protein
MAFFRAFFKVLARVFPKQRNARKQTAEAWIAQARDPEQANNQAYEKY